MPTKKIDRSKRTKAQLEEEIHELEDKLAGQAAPDPTAQVAAKEHAVKTREAVKGISVDNVVTEGANFGLQVQRTVAGLTEKVVAKVEELKTLQEAIELEKAELERLYELDVVSASTTALIEEHKLKVFELERTMQTKRSAWEEEQALHTKAVRQRDADLTAVRARDQQEYDYKTAQERTRAEEEFKYKLQIQERDQAERIAQADKSITLRLHEVGKQEVELAAGKARIEGLDEEIKKKVDAQVAIVSNALKKDLNADFTLQKKELETQLQLANQRTVSLNEILEAKGSEISRLQTQLDAARNEVKDIAKSAVEGASGQLALDKVMQARSDNGQLPRKQS